MPWWWPRRHTTTPSCTGCARQARDAAILTKVLADPEIGGFTVTSVINKPARAILLAVEDFLADRGTGDLLLVYLSCHGVLDDRRRLFFAAKDTRKDRLGATGVESAWVRDQLEHCRARSQILILDSCFSGAFANAKGDDDLDLKGRLKSNGHGRIVLTASAATESAYEGDTAAATGSVFTSALVDGLRTGAADIDHDGRITVDEAYAYTFDQVQAVGGAQTPQLWTYGAEGKIVLARSPAGQVVDRPELPESLRAALDSPLPRIRIAAVGELGAWLDSGDPAGSSSPGSSSARSPATTSLRSPPRPAPCWTPAAPPACRRVLPPESGTGQSGAEAGQVKTAASPGTAQERERRRRATPGKAAGGSGAALPPERKPGTRPLRSAAGPKAPAAGPKAPAADQKARRAARIPSPGSGAATDPHIPSRHLPAFAVPAPTINSLAFSPDGRTLAIGTGSADAAVLLRDPLTGQHLRTLKIDTDPTVDADPPIFLSNRWIAFGPDGRQLATSGVMFRQLWLWDPATGRSQREIRLPGFATTAGFSPDGRQLAVAGLDGTVYWYDPASGRRRGLVRLRRPRAKAIEAVKRAVSGGSTQQPYSSVMFSPGLRALASTSDDSTVRLWNPATGEQQAAFQMRSGSPSTPEFRTIQGEPIPLKGLTVQGGPTLQGFSPDGNLLAVSEGQMLTGVELRDAVTGMLRHRIDTVSVMAEFSPDGNVLATSQGGAVLLWDVATGKQLAVLAPQRTSGTFVSISCLAFGPRGGMLAAAESGVAVERLRLVSKGDPSVRVWT